MTIFSRLYLVKTMIIKIYYRIERKIHMRINITDQNYTAEIDTMGAELKSYRDPDGKEYVWDSNPEYWFRSSPLLFPSIGNVRNGKTIIYGKEYSMDRHGFCKDSEFIVSEQSENRVVFSFSDNEATKVSYPFSFELRLTYELQGAKLIMTYDIYNKDTKEMIYHIGAHPGFNCPLFENETLQDYVLEFDCNETLESYVYDLENLCFSSKRKKKHGEEGRVVALYPEIFDQDALYFYHTNSHGISLKNPATGKGIHMDYPGFASIGIWSPIGGKAPFVCLEPWNGSGIFDDEDDNFASKRDIQRLAVGEHKQHQLTISIL